MCSKEHTINTGLINYYRRQSNPRRVLITIEWCTCQDTRQTITQCFQDTPETYNSELRWRPTRRRTWSTSLTWRCLVWGCCCCWWWLSHCVTVALFYWLLCCVVCCVITYPSQQAHITDSLAARPGLDCLYGWWMVWLKQPGEIWRRGTDSVPLFPPAWWAGGGGECAAGRGPFIHIIGRV